MHTHRTAAYQQHHISHRLHLCTCHNIDEVLFCVGSCSYNIHHHDIQNNCFQILTSLSPQSRKHIIIIKLMNIIYGEYILIISSNNLMIKKFMYLLGSSIYSRILIVYITKSKIPTASEIINNLIIIFSFFLFKPSYKLSNFTFHSFLIVRIVQSVIIKTILFMFHRT